MAEPTIHLIDWRGVVYCDPKLEPKDGEFTSDDGVTNCKGCKHQWNHTRFWQIKRVKANADQG
jgi:hypothetical protein